MRVRGIDGDGVAGSGQFATNVIDREIAFAQGDGQIADAVAGRSRLRSTLRLANEAVAFLGAVAELMAEDTEGADGIAATAGDVAGGFFIDEVGAEGLLLALHGELWGEEELLVAESAYLIAVLDCIIQSCYGNILWSKCFIAKGKCKAYMAEIKVYESTYGKQWPDSGG
jgi:hypothetical protein